MKRKTYHKLGIITGALAVTGLVAGLSLIGIFLVLLKFKFALTIGIPVFSMFFWLQPIWDKFDEKAALWICPEHCLETYEVFATKEGKCRKCKRELACLQDYCSSFYTYTNALGCAGEMDETGITQDLTSKISKLQKVIPKDAKVEEV